MEFGWPDGFPDKQVILKLFHTCTKKLRANHMVYPPLFVMRLILGFGTPLSLVKADEPLPAANESAAVSYTHLTLPTKRIV